MTFLNGFLTKKYALWALFILLALYLYSLWGRIPDIDDAWIGELAYFLAEEGQMRSELMRGITQQEVKFVVNNKLFNLTGALFIKLFGFSLYTLKSVSLLWFVVFLILFYAYTLRWKKVFGRPELLFSLFVMFSFTYLFKFSFLFRPEVMMMTTGLSGYILLEKYLEERSRRSLFLSGLLFGLTCAIHLNGLILIASAGLLLIWNKRFSGIPLFGLSVLIGILPFFYDMTSRSDFLLWYHQFFEAPALDSLADGPVWLKPLFNFLNEYLRYFYKIEVAVYSLLVITGLGIGFRYLFRSQKNLLLFALLNIFFTATIAMHKSQQYLLLNFPYILILITLTFKGLSEGKIGFRSNAAQKLATGIYAFFILTFVFVSFYHNYLLAVQKFSAEENRKLAVKYAGTETKDMNIVAPMTFIFDEIENFNRIQGEVCYIELMKADPTVSGRGLLQKAETFEADLLMFTPFYVESLGLSGFQKGEEVVGYKIVDKTEALLVIKRRKE
jgi:hypothetical protein